MTHWSSELLCTSFNKGQLPPPIDVPEIVMMGRSNVGKSTLINALLGRKIAKVSQAPGKTRSLNFYSVTKPEPLYLVDLPGYGYAARSKSERSDWWRLIDDYLAMERPIYFAIHLVDFRHGLLENDVELTKWLDEIDMPRLIVFTKGDKIARGRQRGMYEKYLRSGLASIAPPLITSGKNDAEMERLREAIIDIIHELKKFDS